jgi:hypothetical protein
VRIFGQRDTFFPDSGLLARPARLDRIAVPSHVLEASILFDLLSLSLGLLGRLPGFRLLALPLEARLFFLACLLSTRLLLCRKFRLFNALLLFFYALLFRKFTLLRRIFFVLNPLHQTM